MIGALWIPLMCGLFLLMLAIMASIFVQLMRSLAETVQAPIKWIRYINPTEGEDLALGVCIFGDYIPVAGWADSSFPI